MRFRSFIMLSIKTSALILALLTAAMPAAAQPDERSKRRGQDFPTKPIRFIVGLAPGGATDIVARAVAQRLTENVGQTVVVDNRPGAAGSIGAALVAKALPDGYTILIVSSSFAINPGLYASLPFHPIKDFAPITLIAQAPFLLVVHPSLPAISVKEFIALAKTKGGEFNFGSGGNGSSGHLAGELFKHLAGITATHVPYKGAGPAMVDVLAGQIQYMFASIVSSLHHVRAGKLRTLAVTSVKRSAAVPEVPTVAQAGVPGYEATTWYGALAPAGTPSGIAHKLNIEIVKAVRAPEAQSRLAGDGAEPAGSTPAQFAKHLDTEITKWVKVIKDSGVRGEQ